MIAQIDSPCGRLWISGDSEKVYQVEWEEIRGPSHSGELDWILPWVADYFAGRHTRFPGGLVFSGGSPAWARCPGHVRPGRMSEKALLEIARIPFGSVKTYGEIAAHLGNPHLARAVGQACGSNPVPVIVPCHRVVGAGSLGGFSSGLDRKRCLLALEGTRYPV